jgi:hypothetical protein
MSMNLPPIQGLILGAPTPTFEPKHTDELPLLLQRGSELLFSKISAKKEKTYLRIINALQTIKELLGGIDNGEIDAQRLGEILVNLLALVEPHDAVYPILSVIECQPSC